MSPRVPPPNYTQAPNVLLDELLPSIDTLAELKVILVVVRQTIGFHKDEAVKLTFSELETRTGMARSAVNRGVQAAIARGIVERRVDGAGGAREAYYDLAVIGSESLPTSVAERNQRRLQDATDVGATPLPSPIEEKETGKKTPLTPPQGGIEQEDWEKVLGHVRSQVAEITFEHYFARLTLVVRDGDRLVLQAPDDIAAWIRDRFLPLLEGAAAQVFGPQVTIDLPRSETEVQRDLRRELEKDERFEKQRKRRPRRGFASS